MLSNEMSLNSLINLSDYNSSEKMAAVRWQRLWKYAEVKSKTLWMEEKNKGKTWHDTSHCINTLKILHKFIWKRMKAVMQVAIMLFLSQLSDSRNQS